MNALFSHSLVLKQREKIDNTVNRLLVCAVQIFMHLAHYPFENRYSYKALNETYHHMPEF